MKSILVKEEAYREIITLILKQKPKSAKELSNIKRKICMKYSLAEFPRNSDILQAATDEERDYQSIAKQAGIK